MRELWRVNISEDKSRGVREKKKGRREVEKTGNRKPERERQYNAEIVKQVWPEQRCV